MIPVLSAGQIRKADQYTIENEPIRSIDLMERASQAFVVRFTGLVERGHRIKIFCGVGNNGGDGLAIGRILSEKGYQVDAYTIGNLDKASEDFLVNYERTSVRKTVPHILKEANFPLLSDQDIVIDAIFGSGLSRPVAGLYGSLIRHLNDSGSRIVSVDIASGLYADRPEEGGEVIQPWVTISFQTPKLSFFQPTHVVFVGRWYIEDIGLDRSFIHGLPGDHFFTQREDISSQIRTRHKFIHKGEVGRLLLVAGSLGKMGAAILSARAAMRTGVGLLMVHIPKCGTEILQMAVPEAMVSIDKERNLIGEVDGSFEPDAIGVGPGLGTDPITVKAFKQFLQKVDQPWVIDADGLNILADNRELLEILPHGTILTPHPGEFRRLVGSWNDDFEKLETLKSFCLKHACNVVLKGAYSAVCNTNGEVFFNPTGNPGMATGGSGDVLTGIIAGLLTQDYEPEQALKIGVYLHGLAGDLATEVKGENSLIASDIIDYIPQAFRLLQTIS